MPQVGVAVRNDRIGERRSLSGARARPAIAGAKAAAPALSGSRAPIALRGQSDLRKAS